jgi:hypothetical protein
MAHPWPKETVFKRWELDVQDRACRICNRNMHVCDHRDRRIFTLGGPVHLLLRLVRCPDKSCLGHPRTFSPEAELSITMPYWAIGWDVFAWVGHRRFARHWSVPQICAELSDSYGIVLSEDAIEKNVRRYQVMLAARQQDQNQLRKDYHEVDGLMLSIDGLQPEKGHETFYVVRELSRRRVWFAESLISSAEAEVRRLLVRARQWAEVLGKPIRLWMSDKQDAFVTGIAAEFPGVPHRYTAIVRIISCVMSPSPCWIRTATLRSRCAAKYAVCDRSNGGFLNDSGKHRNLQRSQRVLRPKCQPSKRTMRQAGWCSIIAPPFAGFSTTTKEGLCIRPACVWSRLSPRFASLSGATWT